MTMTWRDALKQRGILLTIVQLYFLVVRSRTSLLRRIAFYIEHRRTQRNSDTVPRYRRSVTSSL
jgi:hypothetical protein